VALAMKHGETVVKMRSGVVNSAIIVGPSSLHCASRGVTSTL
jgi:hypothetical protein